MSSSKKTMATVLLAVICIAAGWGVGYATAPPKEITKETVVTKELKVPLLKGDILIGYIAASPGHVENTLPAVKMAFDDVNAYVKSMGVDVTFKLLAEAAESSAVVALEKAQALYARGVRFIVGSNWSSQCKAILEYANKNKMVMISDGSTSPMLAIADDYLFRLPATDETQCQALSVGVLQEIGVKALVVLQRADAWGDGNYEYISKFFPATGGVIFDRVRYSGDKTEFSAEVKALSDVVTKATNQYGKGKVAIAIWSFDEIVPIVTEAANYPILFEVPWIGSNGITRSTRLVGEAKGPALKMKILSMMIGVTKSSKFASFSQRYVKLMGIDPGAYVTFAYDAVWLFAKSILEVGEYNPEKVQKILPRVAEDYFGAGGWYKLNEYGDRFGATFEVWTVVDEKGVPTWKHASVFDMATGKATWILKPSWVST